MFSEELECRKTRLSCRCVRSRGRYKSSTAHVLGRGHIWNPSRWGTDYSHNEQRAMGILKESCRRLDSDYKLTLLRKLNRPSLPNNYTTAMRRPESIAQGYSKALGAYVVKGFARKLADAERAESTQEWLLPYHKVLTPHKPLPRVVFDSAAMHDRVCLNDCFEAGSSLHNDLPGIQMRFRHESPVGNRGRRF